MLTILAGGIRLPLRDWIIDRATFKNNVKKTSISSKLDGLLHSLCSHFKRTQQSLDQLTHRCSNITPLISNHNAYTHKFERRKDHTIDVHFKPMGFWRRPQNFWHKPRLGEEMICKLKLFQICPCPLKNMPNRLPSTSQTYLIPRILEAPSYHSNQRQWFNFQL